jgi:hypothetical protein
MSMTEEKKISEDNNAKVGAEAPTCNTMAPESEVKRTNPYAVIANNSSFAPL